ncbi:MAG: helix-turn-helix transcriptional regulator [Promethearchaeota archaeon]
MTNHLRKLREQRMQTSADSTAWTQEGLSSRVKVSRQTIIAIEKGTYNPSLELAFKLAHAFNLTIEEIFTYEGNEHESKTSDR